MTREEVHDLMENELRCVQWASTNRCDRDCAKCPLVKDDEELVQAYGYVIKALEQEPCDVPDTNVGDLISREDAVSRKALISHIENQSREWGEDYDAQQILGDIEDMPSVKPQKPRKVLYSGDGYADGYMVYDMAECPTCGYEYEDGDKDWGLPFCPNCGQALLWESEEE